MKLKLLLFFLPLLAFAQTEDSYVALKNIPSETGIIIAKSTPFSVLHADHSYYGMYNLVQAAKELNAAGKSIDVALLRKAMRTTSYNETIKIGGIHTSYEIVEPTSIANDDIKIIEGTYNIKGNSNITLQKKSKTIISPLTIHKHGLQTSFYLDRHLFTNTTTAIIEQILIDFDNGKGFTPVGFNTPIPIEYKKSGNKVLQFKLQFESGEEILTYSKLQIHGKSLDANGSRSVLAVQDIPATITPDLSIYPGIDSFAGIGQYEVFLSPDSPDLDKPIIVIDGFDPADTRDITAIYDLLTYTASDGSTQNLGDRIRNEEGFDIVVLNLPQYLRLADNSLQLVSTVTDTNGDMIIDENDYPAGSTLIDGGSDFIERNAMTLVALIQSINSTKVGTAENVIIGPSMGGLISRYALNYMEQQALDHDTRLWVSFDSPHLGANVPIGFQHLFNYLAYGLDTWVGDFSVESLRPIVDGMLKSPAARQMLTDHMESHLQTGEVAEFDSAIVLPEPHPYFDLFYNRLNGLTTSGYPETLRKISMINGSGSGNPYLDKMGSPILPGRQVLDIRIDDVALLTDVYLKVWYTHASGINDEVSNIWVDAPFLCFCDINASADSRSESFSDGIDAAMGGLFNLGALSSTFSGADPTIDAFFNGLQTDYFNFIPTISAMALKNQNNWYAIPNPNNGATVNETPFDAWFMPTANEDHVSLTDNNVAFAWNEIVLSTLSNPSYTINDIIVKQNPVQDNTLNLLANSNLEQLDITIYDIAGRKVFTRSLQNTLKDIEISLSLTGGIYLMNLDYEGKQETKKIIIQ